MPVATIGDFSEAMMTSLAGATALFLSDIPRAIGFLTDLDHRLVCRLAPSKRDCGSAACGAI